MTYEISVTVVRTKEMDTGMFIGSVSPNAFAIANKQASKHANTFERPASRQYSMNRSHLKLLQGMFSAFPYPSPAPLSSLPHIICKAQGSGVRSRAAEVAEAAGRAA
jgi:hypothetical protein